jgi:hypothetical protein
MAACQSLGGTFPAEPATTRRDGRTIEAPVGVETPSCEPSAAARPITYGNETGIAGSGARRSHVAAKAFRTTRESRGPQHRTAPFLTAAMTLLTAW